MSVAEAARVALQECMGLKSTESCIIVCDPKKRDIALEFLAEARKISRDSMLLDMAERSRNGEEPPGAVAASLLSSDVALLITEKSISHTKARKQACIRGTRIASLPGITEEMAARAIPIDYDAMIRLARKYKAYFDRGKELRIRTDLGTDIRMSIEGQTFKIDSGICREKGRFSNLPAGEICYSPVEGTTEGVYYVDVTMGTGRLSSPLRITVEKGYATKIEGDEAEKVLSLFDGHGREAFNIAEVGLGLNPKAKVTGIVLEDEKILGTAHIALGNNMSFGGTHDVPLHYDGVFTGPTIHIDDKLIMKDGRFTGPE